MSKKKNVDFSAGGGFYSRPAFHEPIAITVLFGPSGYRVRLQLEGNWLTGYSAASYNNVCVAQRHFTSRSTTDLQINRIFNGLLHKNVYKSQNKYTV